METVIQETQIDPLAKFREQVAAEPKKSMSDKAAEKLQAIGQRDKATKAANAKFAAQFTSLPYMNVSVIVRLLKKISSVDQNMSDLVLERMANKVLRCLRHGWTVTEPHDVTFFGTLTPEEMQLSDEKFLTHLDKFLPSELVSLARYDKDGVKAASVKTAIVPSGKRCALRSKCMRAENRLGSWVTGKSQYCSAMCRGRAKAFEKSGKALPLD